MIRLVVLDVNETLFSLDPVADRFRRLVPGASFDGWFGHVLRDGFAAEAAGAPVAFADLARHHLAAALETVGLAVDEAGIDEVLAGFGVVTAHPDVPAGLRALRDAGVTTVTLTVGDAGITRSFLEREGLTDLVAGTDDARSTGHWKPSRLAYRHVLDEHGVRAEDAALVAVHPWDVMGAQQAGLVGAWLDRDGARYPPAYPVPDVTGATLSAIAGHLG